MNKVLIIPLADPTSVEYLYLSSFAGLKFIERLCWLSKKAGYRKSIILSIEYANALKEILSKAPGQVSQSLKNVSLSVDSTFVFLRRDVFPTVEFLKKIPVPEKEDTLYVMEKDSPVMVIRVSNIYRFFELLTIKSNILSLQKKMSKEYPPVTFKMDNQEYSIVKSHDDIAGIEKSLYHGLIKESESFMSRYVERKISLAITGKLINTAITPNQMSLISIGIGIVGGYFLSFPKISLQVFGAVLFLAHSILDGCDGEIARLKYMESRWGGLLDFWGDNLVHSAVFLGIGTAWGEVTGSMLAPWCSALAITGGLSSAGLVYTMTMRSRDGEGPLYTSISWKEKKDRWVKIADYLSRRDFIYLVLVLAIFGKAHWFLILAAIGAPLFFLFTLWSNIDKPHSFLNSIFPFFK